MSDPGSGNWTPPPSQQRSGQPPPPNQQWSGQPPPPNQQWSGQPPYGWQPAPVGPAPLHLPQYDATIGQAASRFWRKFAVFSGRASRSEYWWWALIAFAISIVLQIVGSLIFGGGFFFDSTGDPSFDLRQVLLPLAPSLVWSVITLVPSVAVTVRRLHDTNRSGWWYLLLLPSLIALVPLLIGLGSLDAERLAAGDVSGVAVGALIGGSVLSVVGGIGGVVVLIFCILGPDPRGVRFDRS